VTLADSFGLKFGNIPLINLRMEFNQTYEFLHSSEAEQCLKGAIRPIHTKLFIWGGMPNDFMTLILQRAILGVEAYLPAALVQSAASLGNLSKELSEKLNKPFSFGSRSAVENIYHRMPAAVHCELSLRHLDQPLYAATLAFYRDVRNPLFHGQQLRDSEIDKIRNAFLHIAHLYRWIDYWFNPEKLIKGGSAFAGIHERYQIEVNNDAP
jgi:hypothetical protein